MNSGHAVVSADVARRMLDALLEGCQIVSPDFRYLYLNDTALHHARTTREALLGRTMMECYPGIETTGMFLFLRRCMEERSPQTAQDSFTYAGGSSATYDLRFLPVEEGVLILSLDVTEQKRNEEEIRRFNHELEWRVSERTAELMDLYNNAPCGYHSLDAEGRFIRINNTELHWLGYRREDVVGALNIRDVLTPESLSRFEKTFAILKSTGRNQDVELEFLRKDGSILPVLISATVLTDGEGKYLMSRTTVTDHTERRRIERELMESQARTLAANRDLESFAYSVSHDLRAPLRAVEGFSRIILEDYAPGFDPECRRLFEVVRCSAQKMDALIVELLALSRITRADLKRERVDMTAMAGEVFRDLSSLDPGPGVRWTLGALPEAQGDLTLLKQVWANLLGNALKYTSRREERVITVEGRCEEDRYVYTVRDNGVGFDPAYAHKLFGVFQRLHPTGEFEGTGVGLAIVHRVVTRHGGETWAEGKPGEGASFSFSLPSREAPFHKEETTHG